MDKNGEAGPKLPLKFKNLVKFRYGRLKKLPEGLRYSREALKAQNQQKNEMKNASRLKNLKTCIESRKKLMKMSQQDWNFWQETKIQQNSIERSFRKAEKVTSRLGILQKS